MRLFGREEIRDGVVIAALSALLVGFIDLSIRRLEAHLEKQERRKRRAKKTKSSPVEGGSGD